MVVVTEAGLYRLTFRSDKPGAKRFQTFVFNVVLPSIRRTGTYSIVGSPERGLTWEAYFKARTGAVQDRLLTALGFPQPLPTRPAAGSTSHKPRRIIDAAQWWEEVLLALESGRLSKDAFRFEYSATGETMEWCQVFIQPDMVIDAVRLAAREPWVNLTREDIRPNLEAQPEWIEGNPKKCFSGSRISIRCWGFELKESSPPAFLKICWFQRQAAAQQIG